MGTHKIKIFILTYRDSEALNANLASLFASDYDTSNTEINIINNHSVEFKLNEEYKNKVIVHHQSLRADWSCGTPARDWNQAIVLGFKSLKDPACEQLILCQDDCVWDRDWKSRLDSIHQTYDFYQCSWGDCFMSFLPSAIVKIGLFDERMCTLGYYEGDFFLRAYLYNREKSSINDYHHKRVWNPTEAVAARPNSHVNTPRLMSYSQAVFFLKWPGYPKINLTWNWQETLFKHTPTHSAIACFIMYPYFECDIENLKDKNYVLPSS